MEQPKIALRKAEARAPFIYRTPILFRDVDAAGTAYYPRLVDLCHCAFESFFSERIGPAYAKVISSGTGFPSVHFEIDFVSPVRHGDTIDIRVAVAQVGRTSVSLAYEARRGKIVLFRAKNVVVSVDIGTMTKKPLSPRMRRAFGDSQEPARQKEKGHHRHPSSRRSAVRSEAEAGI